MFGSNRSHWPPKPERHSRSRDTGTQNTNYAFFLEAPNKTRHSDERRVRRYGGTHEACGPSFRATSRNNSSNHHHKNNNGKEANQHRQAGAAFLVEPDNNRQKRMERNQRKRVRSSSLLRQSSRKRTTRSLAKRWWPTLSFNQMREKKMDGRYNFQNVCYTVIGNL